MTDHRLPFAEKSAEDWSLERERILRSRIEDLGLKIEGTPLESIVGRLHAELEAAGIKFKPKVYLSDEWSCPDGIPVIGMPFYLADPRLSRIEDEMMDGIEAETEEEILGYLRHEAGHAINYAYKLHETPEWQALFGAFGQPYEDEYYPLPFSRNFVRHIPGWYAQKHPDEDFAETFAVWLTPDSNWREVYAGWGCLDKLRYVDAVVKQIGQQDPVVSGAEYDIAADAHGSIEEHYQRTRPSLRELPALFDRELGEIFGHEPPQPDAPGWQPAHALLAAHRRVIVETITYWTGLYEVLVKSLVGHCIERCKLLGLWVEVEKNQAALVEFVALATTLAMNRLYKGDFVIK